MSEISHSGYLVKKGRIIRRWRLRWCHLHGSTLDYFKARPTQKYEKARPSGTITIKDAKCAPLKSGVAKYANSFQITTKSKTYFFYAISTQDFELWKKKLTEAGVIWQVSPSSFIRDDGQILDITEPRKAPPIPSGKPDEIKQMEILQQENEELRNQIARIKGNVDRPAQNAEEEEVPGSDAHVSIVVIGASGDLAKKKTFPSLFSLYVMGLLPVHFTIFGYARSKMTHEEFRKFLAQNFKGNDDKKELFLSNCFYHSGQYDSKESFAALANEMANREVEKLGHRLFYFAIPPSIFVEVAKAVKEAATAKTGWTRVVVEKPFGRDSETFAVLSKDLLSLFKEDQIYRIDHYLGKEMVQNLLSLRFANSIWEPLWSRTSISTVQITFKEDIGTEGRGGYFDEFGIIRDVMQNHLLQIMALIAMEPPITLTAEDIRAEKTRVLLATKPIELEDTIIGQYGRDDTGKKESYLDDTTVPKGSICPTFATSVLHITNTRWNGVPFILKCGKALDERKAEIRIQFKDNPVSLYQEVARNELVITVQPKEAVYVKILAKNPGMSEQTVETELDLTYKERFDVRLPDAYERLIYDALRGDHNLFVSDNELRAAWDIFTPLLKKLEAEKVRPIIYPFGSRGPAESDELVKKYGYKRSDNYQYSKKK